VGRIWRRVGIGVGVGFVLGAILGVVLALPWWFVVALGMFGLIAGGFMAGILSVVEPGSGDEHSGPVE
jgi:hypothetical protein